MAPPSLPDDALADVLRRLPPRSLAAARCVCRPWRALVDGLVLLSPHLLPRSVHGVLLNYFDHRRPHLISRPGYSSSSSSSPAVSGCRIDGKLSFVDRDTRSHRGRWWHVIDHCDGLLLCGAGWDGCLCVRNPATRRWATLPQRPNDAYFTAGTYLVFDPAVSPHYEVFLIPALPEKPVPPEPIPCGTNKDKSLISLFRRINSASGRNNCASRSMEEVGDPSGELLPSPSSTDDEQVYWERFENNVERYWLTEWPPSPYMIHAFSSRTGQWEERAFVREGETDDGARHDSMEELF